MNSFLDNTKSVAARREGSDVGTSPHGLSVELPESAQETLEGSGLSFPAKPLLTFGKPGGDALVEEPDAELEDALDEEEAEGARPYGCEAGFRKSGGRNGRRPIYYPLVLSAAQMDDMERAVSLAIQDAVDALEEEAEFAHEIQPSLDGFNQLYLLLQAAKNTYGKGRAVANECWRQAMGGLKS
jgi:hypothetical protein